MRVEQGVADVAQGRVAAWQGACRQNRARCHARGSRSAFTLVRRTLRSRVLRMRPPDAIRQGCVADAAADDHPAFRVRSATRPARFARDASALAPDRRATPGATARRSAAFRAVGTPVAGQGTLY